MDLSLYLITDSNGIGDKDFYGIVERAVSSGVTMVQLREKTLSSREFYNRALRLKRICGAAGVSLIINDRIDIALAADADGVHLGADDLPVSSARKLLGASKIIGATAKTVEAANAAACEGADYFGIGAFFATSTKTDADIMTPEQIAAVTAAAPIPAVGIGGLTIENLDIIKGSGVKGAAVSSAVMHASDTETAVRLMRERLGSLL